METLVIVKHHLDYNCTLQNWNAHGMGIIRTNDQEKIRMKDTFNSRTLAIICIGENSHITLLRNVFETFGKVRLQKIILWTQMELKEEFFHEISKKSTDLKLFDMLMLNVVAKDKLLTYRLNPFSSPHFKRIKNIWTPNDYVFMDTKFNFHGMTAVVKHDYNLTIQMGNIKKFPIFRIEDKEVFEFALKYNLTLQFFNDVDHFDIELRKRIMLTNNSTQPIDYGMPMSFSSLLIVVPCGNYLSLQDVIIVFCIQKWIFYIILVYVIFVFFEITFLKVFILISRQSHRQEIPNSLVNLCAFRAILGLPFPKIEPFAPPALFGNFIVWNDF
ncbi:GM19375 [Drosophila sechellia]|uniref:GM19375 n=1 Tax=Drosophila sechellia TaxID=7238 RepID=B4HE44_DROSE|nr:GM19375 [Drosophila sechellia]